MENSRPAPSGETRGTRIDELRKLPVDCSTRGTDEERAAHNLKTLADWKPLAPEATTKEPETEAERRLRIIATLIPFKEGISYIPHAAAVMHSIAQEYFKFADGRVVAESEQNKASSVPSGTQAKSPSLRNEPSALNVAPGEAVGRETREPQRNDVVGQILQEFGFKSAAALRTVIVDMRMAESTLRRERDQLKARLQQYTGDYGDSKLAPEFMCDKCGDFRKAVGSTQCPLCLEGK